MRVEERLNFTGCVIDSCGKGAESRFLRGARLAIWMISIVSVVSLGSSLADCSQGGNDSLTGNPLESIFSGVELVRCVFSEGRLVVRHQGRLEVLGAGDRLINAGLLVVDANKDRIVLQSTESRVLLDGQAVPDAMVILSRGEGGGLSVRIFTSEAPKGTTGFALPSGLVEVGRTTVNGRLETAVASSKSGIESQGPED